jgi:hypothetical protein
VTSLSEAETKNNEIRIKSKKKNTEKNKLQKITSRNEKQEEFLKQKMAKKQATKTKRMKRPK